MRFFFFWILCIVLVYILARDKNRSATLWVICALFFGPIALILILVSPKIPRKPEDEAGFSDSDTSLPHIKAELEKIKNEFAVLSNRLNNIEVKINASQGGEESGELPAASLPAQPVRAEEAQMPDKEKDVETNLGKFWLNKIGIIIFSLGIAFLITYTYRYFGPLMKILFGYLVGVTLFFCGLKLEKKKGFINYGRVLLGGAWAIVYFVTYAMYHFDASRILNSQALDLVFLAIVAYGIIWHSLRYKSEELTAVALFIGYATSTLGDINYFTLLSSALLAITALILVYRLQWIKIVFLGVVLTYLTHYFWVIKQIAFSRVPVGRMNVQEVYFLINAGFITIYWLLFLASAHLIRGGKDKVSYEKLSAANFVNFILFFVMVYPKFVMFYPQNKFRFVLALGSLYLGAAALTEKIKKDKLFVSNIIIAVSLLTFAVPLKFIPFSTSLIWLVELPFLLLAGLVFDRKVFRYLSLALALVLFSKFLFTDLYLAGYIKIFGLKVLRKEFICLLSFLSTTSCFSGYRYFKNRSDLSRLEGASHNLYSALSTIYLTVYIWQVVDIYWLTFALAVETMCIAVCGYILRDRYLRSYSLLLLAVMGFRFCFIDRYSSFSAATKWFIISVELICAYAVYFFYRRLKNKSLLVIQESAFPNVLFFAASALLVFVIFTYINYAWISLALGISGVGLFLVGFLIKDRVFRLGGFIIFGITLLRILFVDLSYLAIIYKIISFILIGGLFLGISFVYTKYNIGKH